MRNRLIIYSIGSMVTVTPEIQGMILQANIKAEGVLYLVGWFDDGNKIEHWMSDFELNRTEKELPPKKTIITLEDNT